MSFLNFIFIAICLILAIRESEGQSTDPKDYEHRLLMTIVVGTVFTLLWVLLFAIGLPMFVLCPKNSQMEQQLSLVLCSPRNLRHQYIILFRIGCASEDFDWINANIDIELFGSNKTLIGPMVRFSAARLTDPVDSYMKIIMGRIVPIPKIESIHIAHTGIKGTKIFLFWVKVFELSEKGENEIQFMKINDYVESKQKFLLEYKNKSVIIPEIPTPTLTLVDVVPIICLSTSLIATCAQLFLSSIGSDSKYLWISSTVALSSMIALSVQTIYIWIYKYVFKKSKRTFIQSH